MAMKATGTTNTFRTVIAVAVVVVGLAVTADRMTAASAGGSPAGGGTGGVGSAMVDQPVRTETVSTPTAARPRSVARHWPGTPSASRSGPSARGSMFTTASNRPTMTRSSRSTVRVNLWPRPSSTRPASWFRQFGSTPRQCFCRRSPGKLPPGRPSVAYRPSPQRWRASTRQMTTRSWAAGTSTGIALKTASGFAATRRGSISGPTGASRVWLKWSTGWQPLRVDPLAKMMR